MQSDFAAVPIAIIHYDQDVVFMKTMRNDLSLRALAIQSLLSMSIAVAIPVIARIEGKQIDIWSSFPLLFAGLIGVSAYQSIARLMKRLDAIEDRISAGERHKS